jgi:hypothetical protein
MRSDNGPPFATTTVGGLSELSVWWIKLGITPERIEPGKPQQNGRHERMHRTLAEDSTRPPANNVMAQQLAFDRFRADYNNLRPHEALGQSTPLAHYSNSPRAMPDKPKSPEYPDGMKVLKVDSSGNIKPINQVPITLTKLISGEPVGLLETDESGYQIFYGNVLLATISLHEKEVRVAKVKSGDRARRPQDPNPGCCRHASRSAMRPNNKCHLGSRSKV